MTCDSWTPVQAPSQMGLSNLPKDPETAGSPLTSGKGGLRSQHQVRSTIPHFKGPTPHPPWQVLGLFFHYLTKKYLTYPSSNIPPDSPLVVRLIPFYPFKTFILLLKTG